MRCKECIYAFGPTFLPSAGGGLPACRDRRVRPAAVGWQCARCSRTFHGVLAGLLRRQLVPQLGTSSDRGGRTSRPQELFGLQGLRPGARHSLRGAVLAGDTLRGGSYPRRAAAAQRVRRRSARTDGPGGVHGLLYGPATRARTGCCSTSRLGRTKLRGLEVRPGSLLCRGSGLFLCISVQLGEQCAQKNVLVHPYSLLCPSNDLLYPAAL